LGHIVPVYEAFRSKGFTVQESIRKASLKCSCCLATRRSKQAQHCCMIW